MTPLGPMKKKESLKSSSSLLLPKKLVDDFTHFSSPAPKSCITKVFFGVFNKRLKRTKKTGRVPREVHQKGSACELDDLAFSILKDSSPVKCVVEKITHTKEPFQILGDPKSFYFKLLLVRYPNVFDHPVKWTQKLKRKFFKKLFLESLECME